MPSADGSDPAWRPDEPSAAVRAEELFFEGSTIAIFAGGAVTTLGIQYFFALVGKIRKTMPWHKFLLLAYVFAIFSLDLVYVAATIQLSQQSWIDDRNFPGGPAAYETEESRSTLSVTGDACLIISTILSDALLLWRCTVVYQSTSVSPWIVNGLAGAFWITEIVLGTLLLVTLTHVDIFGTTNVLLALWCYSLALNVLVTLLICGRLAYYRFLLKKTLGGNAAAPYTSIVAMIVESEALYSTYLIVFIVPLIRNNPLTFTDPESCDGPVCGCSDDRIAGGERQGVEHEHTR